QLVGVRAEAPERNEIQIRRVEHEFDADENDNRISARHRPGKTNCEEERGHKEISVQRRHLAPPDCSFAVSRRARITAPIKAAVSNKPRTSNGRMYRVMSSSPSWRTLALGIEADSDGSARLERTAAAITANTTDATATPTNHLLEKTASAGGSLPRVKRMAKTIRIATAPT